MAISDRLTKLTTDITNAYTSIENKGGTIPSDKNTNNLATAINSIEVIEEATAEGEDLTLTNTKAMPFKSIKVNGKTEQESTTGKQLFNKNSLSPSNCTLVYNNGIYKATKTGSSPKIESNISLLAGNYTINSIGNLGTIIFYNGNTQVKSISSNHTYYNFTLESDVDNVKFWFSGDTYNFDFDTLMIASGTYTSETMPDYEPYTNGASPNPNYPQEIKNVEGKNILDITKSEQGGIDANGNLVSGNSFWRATNFIEVNPNAQITLSSNTNITLRLYEYDKDFNFISPRSETVMGTKLTITTTSNTKYLKWSLFNQNGITQQYVNSLDLMLEEGSVTSPFVPYNSIEFKVQSENKFNKNTITQDYYLDSNGDFVSNAVWCISDFIPIIPNNKYEYNGLTVVGQAPMSCYYDINKNFISSFKQQIGLQDITIPNNAYYVRFTIYKSSTELNNFLFTAIQTALFTFEEGQYLAEGGYLADDGIHNVTKEHIFTGEESISGGNSNTIFYYVDEDVKMQSDANVPANIYSNQYKAVSFSSAYAGSVDYGIAISYNNYRIGFRNKDYADKDAFKAYLATQYTNGTPVKALYPLAEEVVTPYTPTQQAQYYKMQRTFAYEDITHTSTDGDLRPSTEVKYYKKK